MGKILRGCIWVDQVSPSGVMARRKRASLPCCGRLSRIPSRPLPFAPVVADAPLCAECGSMMTRNGSCYKCGKLAAAPAAVASAVRRTFRHYDHQCGAANPGRKPPFQALDRLEAVRGQNCPPHWLLQ